MSDFGYIVILLVALCVVSWILGTRLSRYRLAPWLLGTGIFVALSYALVLYDRLFIANLLPIPWVAFTMGNCLLLPITVGLATVAALRLPGSTGRRFCLLMPLVLGGAWHTLSPLMGIPPATERILPDKDGVVRQTTESSCSAASAATLLLRAGISATESELAQLCFTRHSGTPMLGVYRGLSRKTAGKGWQVTVLSKASLADLKRACMIGPVLISVGLDRWQRGYDPRYVTDWGWTPGKRHAIVLFGFLPGDKLDIGDPSVGRETWDQEALTVLWNGEGVQLRPTSGAR